MGLGAAAPLFAAVTRRYVDAHFGPRDGSRFVALLGDAERDEGHVWEALADPATRGLGNVLWVVDFNRQSLDRVVHHGRLFYCTSTGSFSSHPILLDERSRAAGREVLEVVDRAIETGFLAAAPTEEACDRCDFRPVCGSDVFRRIARKPPESLADLSALRSRP